MPDEADRVVRFPFSRVPGRGRTRSLRELGLTRLARMLDPDGLRASGHWCGRCEGVWYGMAAEVECPVCGNRHG